jgi:hypothetical protein
VIQLRNSLVEQTPTTWRRVLVPGEIKLSKLHTVFQAAMACPTRIERTTTATNRVSLLST